MRKILLILWLAKFNNFRTIFKTNLYWDVKHTLTASDCHSHFAEKKTTEQNGKEFLLVTLCIVS